MKSEYRNKSLTKIFGSPYLGCYALAVAIFSLGLIRDALYVPPHANGRELMEGTSELSVNNLTTRLLVIPQFKLSVGDL
jgi:hypothetical protein